jgi:hypothetical protein
MNSHLEKGESRAVSESNPRNGREAEPSGARERYRQAARPLVARGEILITQNEKVADPSFAKGVMELKLPSQRTVV